MRHQAECALRIQKRSTGHTHHTHGLTEAAASREGTAPVAQCAIPPPGTDDARRHESRPGAGRAAPHPLCILQALGPWSRFGRSAAPLVGITWWSVRGTFHCAHCAAQPSALHVGGPQLQCRAAQSRHKPQLRTIKCRGREDHWTRHQRAKYGAHGAKSRPCKRQTQTQCDHTTDRTTETRLTSDE